MKKQETFYCIYNLSETKMYGMFPERASAEKWIKKIYPVLKEDFIIKKSSFEMELPSGVDFSNEKDTFELDDKLTPMQNMALFIEWSFDELKNNLNTSYEGIVALEIMSSIVRMGKVLRQSEEESMRNIDKKLKESHKQFLEAGKIFGIEFMLNYTYDYWRNQDEKDVLVSSYYDKMQAKNNGN
jgi:hypothetical protein